MNDDDKKIVITNLTKIKRDEEEQLYRDAARSLLKMVEHGLSADEMLRIVVGNDKVVDMRKVAFLKEIINIAIRVSNKSKANDIIVTLQELLAKIDEQQKFLYKGKDGKDYQTSAAVKQADEQYKSQIYIEKETSKHM